MPRNGTSSFAPPHVAPWEDFIGRFMSLTEGTMSPERHRRWAGIALVAGALERRVWARVNGRFTFPNLYTLLVAPPGVGKFVIEDVRSLWSEAVVPNTKLPAFKVAPDNMTKASLLDRLARSSQSYIPKLGPPISYHSLLVAAEEFSVLMPSYDMEYIGVLNSIYTNKVLHEEERRFGVKEVRITNPQLNILGGVQPGWLGSTFPEEAWTTGLTSRIMMIYSPTPVYVELTEEVQDSTEVREQVVDQLGRLSQMYGQVKWSLEAWNKAAEWYRAGMNTAELPLPQHSKLIYYNNRRHQHLVKLTIISMASRSMERVIELTDVIRAMAWMKEAEEVMPDIFRAMLGKSDISVIDEMHYFVTSVWAKNKGKPVSLRLIVHFLMARTEHWKVDKLIEMSEKANIIARVAGTADLFVPRPKHEHGSPDA